MSSSFEAVSEPELEVSFPSIGMVKTVAGEGDADGGGVCGGGSGSIILEEVPAVAEVPSRGGGGDGDGSVVRGKASADDGGWVGLAGGDGAGL